MWSWRTLVEIEKSMSSSTEDDIDASNGIKSNNKVSHRKQIARRHSSMSKRYEHIRSIVTIIQFCPSEAPRVGSVVDPVKLPPSTLVTVQHLVVLYRTTSMYVCRGPKSGPYAPSPN